MQRRYQVRNSIKIGYRTGKHIIAVCVGKSVRVESTLNVLENEGFILGQKALPQSDDEERTTLIIYRRYVNGVPALSQVVPVKGSNQSVPVTQRSLYTLHRGLGSQVLSTSHGIITDQDARKRRLGGQVLFGVY